MVSEGQRGYSREDNKQKDNAWERLGDGVAAMLRKPLPGVTIVVEGWQDVQCIADVVSARVMFRTILNYCLSAGGGSRSDIDS
ncbi:hypothetical protein AURDEDRAFT_112535 [Auricularia subglabra TFB-10046 SS5]|nr:hypothetical protein AURDEDRAFT_112535 [Auricularia subglabra TFB-10046 SS5]